MPRAARYEPRGDRPLAFHAASLMLAFGAADTSEPFEIIGNAAVVSIAGPLVHAGGPFCFFDSYDAIVARVSAALKSDASFVVLKFDSPGGDAMGCMEAARAIRALGRAAEKKIYAFADGMLASAAYALACAADAIYTPEAALVGSVGVLQTLVDVTRADAMQGLKFDLVASGARKLDSNPHVAVSEATLAEVQSKVDGLAGLFFELVEELRGVKASAVKALEANTFLGREAVANGLADGVMSFSELIAMGATGDVVKPKAQAAPESEMDKKEMRAWLAKMAEGTGEEAEKAKAALKCLDESDAPPPKDEKKDPPAEEKKEAKAEFPPPPAKDEKKDDDDTKAAVTALAEVRQLKAERAREVEDRTRAELFARRPDFSEQERKTLAKVSLDLLREAVETWPKIVGLVSHEATVRGTQGKNQGDESARVAQLPPAEAQAMAERMGLSASTATVRRDGNTMTFPVITGDQAKALASKGKVA